MAEDAPIVRYALNGLKSLGVSARLVINNGGMDANNIVAHGIPAVTVGTGQAKIHTVHEIIELEKFYTSCQLGAQLAVGEML